MLKLENISRSYKKTRALIDFSYEFGRGVTAILGPNGSGKTTLFNIITGNLKPDSGKVTLDSNGSRRIGFVPQYPGMYPDFTVAEMLDYTAKLARVNDADAKSQIDEVTEAFDLGEYSGVRVRALSGGTKQRLASAQAFIGSPELVVLDEPTAGLDPMQRILFKNYINRRKGGAAILISTHITSDVEDVADKIIFLRRGQLILDGSIGEICEKFRGRCWELPAGSGAPENIPCRTSGERVRVISETCPAAGAVSVEPELDDCYLAVFGEDGAGKP